MDEPRHEPDPQAVATRAVLVVGVPAGIVARFPPLLWRSVFELQAVANPRLGLRAVESRAFDLILVGFPLPEMDFQRFLDEVRSFGSPCRQAPVAAVVGAAERRVAAAFVGRGLNRVVVASDRDEELVRSLAELLNVAPRVAVRLPIDLQTTIRSRDRRFLTQTVNLSRSGMQIRDPGGLRVGSEVAFEVVLPGEVVTLSGRAEVVWLGSRSGGQALCGLRFTALAPHDVAALADYVERHLE
jgi:CheY-like chemotaxis protein